VNASDASYIGASYRVLQVTNMSSGQGVQSSKHFSSKIGDAPHAETLKKLKIVMECYAACINCRDRSVEVRSRTATEANSEESPAALPPTGASVALSSLGLIESRFTGRHVVLA